MKCCFESMLTKAQILRIFINLASFSLKISKVFGVNNIMNSMSIYFQYDSSKPEWSCYDCGSARGILGTTTRGRCAF